MPESNTAEQDLQQLLLDGPNDIDSFLQLRSVQAQSAARRHELETLVVELAENPALGDTKLGKAAAALAVGVGLWALGRIEDALAALAAASGFEADYFVGRCYLEAGFYDRAAEALRSVTRAKAATKYVGALARAEAIARGGDPATALAELKALAKDHKDDPRVPYLMGVCHDLAGRHDDAIAAYEKAINIDPTFAHAIFRLGFNAALRGDDQKAREHYEAIVDDSPVYINALINLGCLYEDLRDYEKAIECFRRVLRMHPTHLRARLYLKDAHASLDTVYDEGRQRELDRQSKLLAIPITDFELTVRARNCLQHMNIYTLGDLVSHTEEELLAWKNFGDTSLQEIKEMLTVRNLHLGQTRDECLEIPSADELLAGEVPDHGGPVDEAVLLTPISDLNLSVRSRKCMERLGIATVGQLVAHAADELLASRNFGRTSLVEIAEKLTQLGLTLSEPEPPEGEGGEDEAEPEFDALAPEAPPEDLEEPEPAEDEAPADDEADDPDAE